jgi:N6-adenosine-specific RNA methylase IME4
VNFFAPLEPKSFDLIHVDFPWDYKTYSAKGRKKSPQYDLMTFEQIVDSHPEVLLKPAGVAVFWLTWPHIAKQSMIIENCFGLEIKTGGCWSKRTKNNKLRWGTGYIIRSVCEPFVIACRKGHKLRGRAEKNLIGELSELELPGLAREHSRKPEEMYSMLERMSPGWRRADLFARQKRAGWSAFGHEQTKFNRSRNGISRLAA